MGAKLSKDYEQQKRELVRIPLKLLQALRSDQCATKTS